MNHTLHKYGGLIVTVSVIVAVAIAAFLFFEFEKPAKEEPPEKDGPRQLEVVAVASKTLNRSDRLPGEIYAYQDVAIYPKVPGFIEWISVDRGSIVKKGQLMVGLIAPEMVAQRNQAQANAQSVKSQVHEAESQLAAVRARLMEARAKLAGDNDTYERTKKASETPGVVAANTVIVLENLVKADQESIEALKQQVVANEKKVQALVENLIAAKRNFDNFKDLEDYLRIAAPFDGYITERNMHVGSFVGPLGKEAYPPIVRIQQLNNLRVVAPVPEVDTAGVEPGQPVEFTVSTHPGRKFTGKVARVGNYLDHRTRTMPVELNFWNTKNFDVLPGMFCEVYWPTRRKYPTLFAPSSAVVNESTLETFVCKVNDKDEIEWVKVRKGQTMGHLIEVFGDIKAGDRVAVKGTDEIPPGTPVKPVVLEPHEVEAKPPHKRPSYPTHHGS